MEPKDCQSTYIFESGQGKLHTLSTLYVLHYIHTLACSQFSPVLLNLQAPDQAYTG